jgi:hypothetical protein
VRLRTVVDTGTDVLVGTLRDERLVLQPDEGGEPLRFRPGSREDYEAAARAVRETATDIANLSYEGLAK